MRTTDAALVTEAIASPNGRRHVILIHCQYVYGIGHFIRSIELARALAERFDVLVLNGGEPVPNYSLPKGVKCIQLPAIFKEEQADTLSAVDPEQSLDDCFKARATLISNLVQRYVPDVLITEHFPFGLLFEDEVLALIEQVKRYNPRVKIVASVRDVVESVGGGPKDSHTCMLLDRLYDLILVHGDNHIVPFSASFPALDRVSVPILHTGYVVRKVAPAKSRDVPPLIVVSVGGGRVGRELLYSVLDAHHAASSRWPHRLALFTGAFQPDGDTLARRALELGLPNVSVHQFDQVDYHRVLSVATGVICLGGYNSLLEAVSARLSVLVYNRTFHGENHEQALRLAHFVQAGIVHVLKPEDLVQERMVDRILALTNPRPFEINIAIDGAACSADAIVQLLAHV